MVSPLGLCWVKGVRSFRCHLHFWQNDRGLLCATAVTQGWNTPQKVDSGEENSPAAPVPGFKLANLVWRSNQQAIPATHCTPKYHNVWTVLVNENSPYECDHRHLLAHRTLWHPAKEADRNFIKLSTTTVAIQNIGPICLPLAFSN